MSATYKSHRSIRDFAATHGLQPHLLRVPSRENNTWALLTTVQEALAEMRDLQQSMPFSEVVSVKTGGNANLIRAHLWACGSYPVDPDITSERWANPTYSHGDEYQHPAQTRQAHIERAVTHPTVTLRDIGPRFNIEPASMQRWAEQNRLAFKRRQIRSAISIGKTIKTNAEWMNTDAKRYIERYPAPTKTVEEWVYRRPEVRAFDPPTMPQDSNWTEGRS
jgi:hypothetical protein